MAIPDYQTLMRPLLAKAAGSAGEISVREVLEPLGNELGLTEEDRAKLLPSGQFPVFHNRLHWAKTY